MAVFLEIVKAFQNPDGAERGAWILYGQTPLGDSTHQSAVDAASWPSNSADIVIWGNVTRLADGYVVEPFVAISPIVRRRDVQPDLLEINFNTGFGHHALAIANSAAYFDLEPFSITDEAVTQFGDYAKGVPIYSSPFAAIPIAYTNGILVFRQIGSRAALVDYGSGRLGWIKLPTLSSDELAIVEIGQGLIRILRHWTGAEQNFNALLRLSSLPNRLR